MPLRQTFQPLRNLESLACGLICAAALLLPGAAIAQTYPTKPIKLVLAQPPGGATDVFARLITQKMTESMGQPVVIEYKPGANNMIAIQAVAAAPKDGYTLMMGTTALGLNPIMYKKLNYKVEDFAPISVVALPSFAMSISKTVPAKNLREFVDYVKARPGKINYGTLGPGSTGHLLGMMFEEIAGIKMQDVPYKGAAATLTALVAGDISVYFDNITTSVPQHRSGAINILGVTAEQRVPAAPDVPTMKEQGVPMVAASWFGILAPAGTPRPIILRLNKEIQAAVASSDYQTRLNASGATPASSASPEEFAALIQNLTELWGRIPKRLGMNFD
jgi:tripartite-type tricarboxylate transporter receptor subunit TctC